jgi:hypothetical protein
VLRRPTAVRSHCCFDRQATDCTTGRKGHRTTAQCSRRRRRRSRGDEAVATTGITSGRMPPTWARRVPSIRLLCTTTTTHHRLTTLQQPTASRRATWTVMREHVLRPQSFSPESLWGPLSNARSKTTNKCPLRTRQQTNTHLRTLNGTDR